MIARLLAAETTPSPDLQRLTVVCSNCQIPALTLRYSGGEIPLRVAMTQFVPDAVLTIEELAVYLKIAKSTLYKLAQEGRLPGQKVGRHWRFHRDSIDQWLKNEPSSALSHKSK